MNSNESPIPAEPSPTQTQDPSPDDVSKRLTLQLQYESVVNLARQQYDLPIIRDLTVGNSSDRDIENVLLRLRIVGGVSEMVERRIARIPAHGTVNLGAIDLPLDPMRLREQVEREQTYLEVGIEQQGRVSLRERHPIGVLAWNEWSGLRTLPELLAAFVLPNDADVSHVLGAARSHLLARTGSDAFDGYQSKDRTRVHHQIEALWDALADWNLGYLTSPPRFEEQGQKVRLVPQLAHQRQGSCLDFSVLFASVLEAVGLAPLIVLVEGHAFPAVWSHDTCFPDACLLEATRLLNRVEIGEILAIESTLLADRTRPGIEAALAEGVRRLRDVTKFSCAIDIRRARAERIRPLPLRRAVIEPKTATSADPRASTDAQITVEPDPTSEVPSPDVLAGSVPERGPARIERWKDALLDTSLNNRLLAFRETTKTLPLLVAGLGPLMEKLAIGDSLLLSPLPAMLADGRRDLETLRQRLHEDVTRELLSEELRHGRLTLSQSGGDLQRRLVELYREARSIEEETGTNSLFLILGFLSWYESRSSQGERRAPVVMIPVHLERSARGESYRLVATTEEARLNITLLKKLRDEFRLDVTELERLADAEELDVTTALAALRRIIVDENRWQVREEAAIGILQFQKFLLYRDLVEHADHLLESEVVRHIVERSGHRFGDGTPFTSEDRLDDVVPPGHLVCPLDADSSQLAAVKAASDGRSFVLQGPPGTGKSQTITNLIAHALASGKRILFVAEKAAALDVVFERLRRIGLDRACLAVHSSRTGKKDALEQIRATQTFEAEEPKGRDELVAALARQREELNGYVRALHLEHANGLSVFRSVAELVRLGEGPWFPIRVGDPTSLSESALRQQMEAVGELERLAIDADVQSDHPLQGIRRIEWTPSLDADVTRATARLAERVLALRTAQQRWRALWSVDSNVAAESSAEALEQEAALAQALVDAPAFVSAELVSDPGLLAVAARLEAGIEAGERDAISAAALAEEWMPEFQGMSPGELRDRLGRAQTGFVLLQWWHRFVLRRRLARVRRRPLGPGLTDLERALAAMDERAAAMRTLEAWKPLAARAFGSAGATQDWSALRSALDWSVRVRRALDRLAAAAGGAEIAAGVARGLANEGWRSETFTHAAQAFSIAWTQYCELQEALRVLLGLDLNRAFGLPADAGFLARVETRGQGFATHVKRLRGWMPLQAALGRIASSGHYDLAKELDSGRLEPGQVVAAARRSFHQAFVEAALGREPRLARFHQQSHEAHIEEFRRIETELFDLDARLARHRCAKDTPRFSDRGDSNAASEVGILTRELKKKARHLPLRRLFERLPTLLPRLKPCLLMSPLSVAQYLSPKWPRADIVVFDEASQIPVWDAIGALGRGKAALVVGDSRQLPPTTFFTSLDAGGEDVASDEGVTEDLESILDECCAAGIPEMSLRWHYRSKHESLIAFSNVRYYENRLYTFPSVEDRRPGLGLTWRFVTDGKYERGGTSRNRPEAEAIVAEVVQRLRSAAKKGKAASLGVVAFSRQQSTLIEDLLDDARRKHPDIEGAFSGDEPVFVKNLENVQGDERDVILFSICYGPDALGRVFMNFGPLNRVGGERRLNVAITRSRTELVVFTSLEPDQIDPSRTSARGVLDLKAFLDYAKRGEAALLDERTLEERAAAESPLEVEVASALEARGHVVKRQVGCAGYRIDLAIVDPECEGRFDLGIECDGATYHSAATARDRDRSRQSVLERLGWTLHRVWSTDWWHDRQSQIARIEATLSATRGRRRAAEPQAEMRVAEGAASEVPDSISEAPAVLDVDVTPAASVSPYGESVVVGPSSSELSSDDPESVVGKAGSIESEISPSSSHGYRVWRRPKKFDAAIFDRGDVRGLGAIVDQIVAEEGPIVDALLQRRLAETFERRKTAKVKEFFDAGIAEALARGSIQRHDDALWRMDMDPSQWRERRVATTDSMRDLDEIPLAELANAAEAVVRRDFGLPVEDLVKQTAIAFGVGRLTARMKERLAPVVDRLVGEGRLVVSEGQARLP